MTDTFWTTVRAQLKELEAAKSADDVLRILSTDRNPDGPDVTGAPGFFAGSGGDDTVADALREAGWKTVWSEASYYYCMKAGDGSMITYIEGDIYVGDSRAKSA